MKCGEETDLIMRKNVLRKYQYAQRSHEKIVTKLRVALIRRDRFLTNRKQERIRKAIFQAYEGEKDRWLEDWFLPVLEHIHIRCLSWESISEYSGSVDTAYSIGLQDFY